VKTRFAGTLAYFRLLKIIHHEELGSIIEVVE
jgi:hypothetical protein